MNRQEVLSRAETVDVFQMSKTAVRTSGHRTHGRPPPPSPLRRSRDIGASHFRAVEIGNETIVERNAQHQFAEMTDEACRHRERNTDVASRVLPVHLSSMSRLIQSSVPCASLIADSAGTPDDRSQPNHRTPDRISMSRSPRPPSRNDDPLVRLFGHEHDPCRDEFPPHQDSTSPAWAAQANPADPIHRAPVL